MTVHGNSKTRSDLRDHFLELPFEKVRPRRVCLTLGVFIGLSRGVGPAKRCLLSRPILC